MRLTTVFLFVSALTASAGGFSQGAKISLSLNEVKLTKLFKVIEKETEYRFAYSNDIIPTGKFVTIQAKNEPVSEILETAISGTNLKFRFDSSSNLIIISEKTTIEAPVTVAKTVTGKVTNDKGEPMPGVTIQVKGTNTYTQTDSRGFFKIVVDDNQKVLIFSFVDYETQEINITGKSVIDVTLTQIDKNLGEVVVTAFGKKQRKEAVIGSVTSVSAKELKVPASNLTSAFAGRISGVISYQRTGDPGLSATGTSNDNAQFFIRGLGTFGSGSGNPLILIDNIEVTTTDLARLQPDDIESFSVLKDASSTALYGARGANGVIFVTTKQGKTGKAKVNLRIENSISSPTKNLEFVDGATYMDLYTEAQLTRDPLSILLYPEYRRDQQKAGGNPVIFPNTDWMGTLFNKNTQNRRANVSVSGGSETTNYYVSASVNEDNGILKVPKLNNFNSNVKLRSSQLRSNIGLKLTRTTDMMIRFSGVFDEYKGPIGEGSGIYGMALRTSPTLFLPYYQPDSANIATKHLLFGSYRLNNQLYVNPLAEMVRGYSQRSKSTMMAQVEINQKLNAITPGLNLRIIGETDRYSFFSVNRAYGPYYYYADPFAYDKQRNKYSLSWLNEPSILTTSIAGLYPAYEALQQSAGSQDVQTKYYFQGMLDYSRAFAKKHNVGGTLVTYFEQRLFPSINPPQGVDPVQASLAHRTTGVSGRASYSYDNRYFAEFNFGYNGSERFYKNHQFGFFPTFGIGWLVSNEKFWDKLAATVSKLKLRASYGLVGNDAIGNVNDRFFYLSQVNLADLNRGFAFGTEGTYTRPGVSISRYAHPDISWEKSKQLNMAVEIGIANRLNLVVEHYRQNRSSILMQRASIPTTMGLAAGIQANVGKASSKGLDIAMDYTQTINRNFWLAARGTLTFATSKFEVYEEPDYPANMEYLSKVGYSLGQSWGLIAERLFIDEKDVQNSPTQNFGRYGAGDIKYRDVNGDGRITGNDIVPIGNPTVPELTYGGGISMGYKNFDFSVFLQGTGRTSFWIDAAAVAPFVNRGPAIQSRFIEENNILKAFAESHWSEDNRNIYAVWPRLSTSVIENNTQRSTWWMRDGSFLRVKSMEIGYSLPVNLVKKLKLSNVRFYANGTNLFTFSNFNLWDVEMGGNGLAYPLQKVVNFAVNINF